MKINIGGVWDVYYSKYDDNISIAKPHMAFKNLMFGGFYIDIEGIVEAVSHTTGARVEAEFVGKSGDTPAHLTGKCFTPNNELKYKIEGTWQDELRLITVATGSSQMMWREQPMMEDANLQFFFGPLSLMMNYINP